MLIKLLELVFARHVEPLAALAEDLRGGLVHFELLRLLGGRPLLAAALEVRLHHLLRRVVMSLRLLLDHLHQSGLGRV